MVILRPREGRGPLKVTQQPLRVHVCLLSTSLKHHSPCFSPAGVAHGESQAQGERRGSHHPSYPGANTGTCVSLCPLQDISKRLSLPMDIRLPQEFLQKLQLESPDLLKRPSRMSRRASLVSPERVRGHQGGTAILVLRVPAEVASGFQGGFCSSGATRWP